MVDHHKPKSIIKTADYGISAQFGSEMLLLDKGIGSTVWDIQGKDYIDFGAGIAVNALGYGNENLARIMADQARKLIHVSNLWATEPALKLYKNLMMTSPIDGYQSGEGPLKRYFDAAHLGNSGSEANEAAIKYARLYAKRKANPNGHKILSFTRGFHGRTLGALSATATEKYKESFAPLLPGFDHCEYNDVAALVATLNREFAAVLVEPVQGEGGLDQVSSEFAAALNRLCSEHDVLLIADEIQTGLFRTGTLFASQSLSLKPDIITLSKPLAAGLPLSATLIPKRVNELLRPGDHGGTFGGGPVTTAVANEVLNQMLTAEFQGKLTQGIEELDAHLNTLLAEWDCFTEKKGAGMLRGLAVNSHKYPNLHSTLGPLAAEEGLLILRSGTNVLRFAPPLTINKAELELGFERLARAIDRSLKLT